LDKIKIIVTGDGSHSLLNEALDETYHSRHGAVRESQHVFIEHGFKHVIKTHPLNSISVLEVGFGTGLNALLTLGQAEKSQHKVEYTGVETNPLPKEVWMNLNYPDPNNFFSEIHEASWQKWCEINAHFSLFKIEKPIQQVELLPSHYDLIYFDAFAPNKQAEMWELAILDKVVNALKPSGVFVTYCAKGQLKRDLKSLGLVVESLPGPPGKREMVRANKK
jgi:tRNA U34 5-methylaminomethyl-2-thiouridine-forming methyltransferase MnmC